MKPEPMRDAVALIYRLQALFAEQFHIDVPSADTDLLESGLLDSLRLVELLLLLEQDFGVHIPLESIAIDDLRTLARLAEVIALQQCPAAEASPHVAGAVD